MDVHGVISKVQRNTFCVIMLYNIILAGTYSKALTKMVYMENRWYLPETSALRKDETNFPSKLVETLPPPRNKSHEAIRSSHIAYDYAKNK